MKKKYYYKVYNTTIETPFPIIELLEIPPQKVDLRIQEKKLPDSLEIVTTEGSFFQNTMQYQIQGNKVFFTIENVGKYFIKNENEVFIHRVKGVSDSDICIYLLGTCFAYLNMLKGYFSLHGSAIKTENGCIIFTGDSGVGKSTTAAGFIAKGYEILSDDVCVISFDNLGKPIVYPAFPQLKLWDNSVEKLGFEKEGLNMVSKNWQKFRIPTQGVFYDEPLPLIQIIELVPSDEPEIKLIPLHKFDKMTVLLKHTFRNYLIPSLGLEKQHFAFCSRLAAHIDVVKLERPKHLFLLNELINLIETEIVVSV